MLAAQQGETLAALKMRKQWPGNLHGARGAAACRRHFDGRRASLSEMEEMLAQCLDRGGAIENAFAIPPEK